MTVGNLIDRTTGLPIPDADTRYLPTTLVVARLASPVTGVTGDNTLYTILPNEIKDIGNVYNPATGIITIATKGIYQVSAICKFTGINIGGTNDRVIIRFTTTPETIIWCDNDDGISTASGNLSVNGRVMREFNIGDTIEFQATVTGAASKNVGIAAGTYFACNLVLKT